MLYDVHNGISIEVWNASNALVSVKAYFCFAITSHYMQILVLSLTLPWKKEKLLNPEFHPTLSWRVKFLLTYANQEIKMDYRKEDE